MNSFNSKITNRKLNSQKQGGLHGDAADGSIRGNRTQGLRGTGHNDNRQRSNQDKGEHRDLYTHREGRGNWTQVKHMRTGADNHRQEVKKENTLDTETTK